MAFVDDYKDHGGRVTLGSDSGYIYKLYGFGYIREFELLQEAGFHPLEVVRSATLWGAEALGRGGELGSIEPGKLADLVILSKDLFSIPPRDILDTKPVLTMVGGRIVFDALATPSR